MKKMIDNKHGSTGPGANNHHWGPVAQLCPPNSTKIYDYQITEDGFDGGCCSDSSDEFYCSPSPSEDIWKKFELIPTPPRSPTRDPVTEYAVTNCGGDLLDVCGGECAYASAAEKLSIVSEMLDVDETASQTGPSPHGWPGRLLAGLKWDLLHDCMWSGQCTDSCKQKNALWSANTPSVGNYMGVGAPPSPVDSLCASPDLLSPCERPVSPNGVSTNSNVGPPCSPLLPMVSSALLVLPTSPSLASSCVNPCSVLPPSSYTPLSDHSYYQAPGTRSLGHINNVLRGVVIKEECETTKTKSNECREPSATTITNTTTPETFTSYSFSSALTRRLAAEEESCEAVIVNIGATSRNQRTHFNNVISLSDTPSDSDDEIDVVTVSTTDPSLNPFPLNRSSHQPLSKNLQLNTVKFQQPNESEEEEDDDDDEDDDDEEEEDEEDEVSVKSCRGRPRRVHQPNLVPNATSHSHLANHNKSNRRPKTVLTPSENVCDSVGLWSTPLTTDQNNNTSSHRVGPVKGKRGRKRFSSDSKKVSARKYRRFKKSSSSIADGSRSSSDSEDCEKRSQHNSMERKRRDDLRFAFQTLREEVPDLQDKPKAPKVMILNKAAVYAKQLTNTGVVLERALRQEAKRRSELQRRLNQLQRMK